MKKLLLDTSVIIDFLRSKDKQNTLFFRLARENLSISIITHSELYAGKSVWEKKEAREELEKLFSGMTILPFDEEISKKAGYLKARSHISSLLDCIIGASSIHYELELATLNVSEFRNMNGITLYRETRAISN